MIHTKPDIQVYLRIRPSPSDSSILTFDPSTFRVGALSFACDSHADCIFDEAASQHEVFRKTTLSTIDHVIQGHQGAVFVYGQTNSGKTYTMLGDSVQSSPNSEGLIQHTLRYLLSQKDHDIQISYFEVYRELIYDLLDVSSSKSGSLRIRENLHQQVYIDGLIHKSVGRFEEAMQLLTLAEDNRKRASTLMNLRSSRSHAVLHVKVGKHQRVGHLYLVDLAGSEKTEKAQTKGLTLEETKMINQSLSALAKVVQALSQPTRVSTHVPYRDSKLTRVLQNVFSDKQAHIRFICTVCPAAAYEQETLSTLRFAQSARNMKLIAPKRSLIQTIASNSLKHEALQQSVLQAKLSASEEALAEARTLLDLQKRENCHLSSLLKFEAQTPNLSTGTKSMQSGLAHSNCIQDHIRFLEMELIKSLVILKREVHKTQLLENFVRGQKASE